MGWVHRVRDDADRQRKEAEDAALRDKDEFVVEAILDHRGTPAKKSQMDFLVHWLGYPSSEDSWIPYSEAKDLIPMDAYLQAHPELKL